MPLNLAQRMTAPFCDREESFLSMPVSARAGRVSLGGSLVALPTRVPLLYPTVYFSVRFGSLSLLLVLIRISAISISRSRFLVCENAVGSYWKGKGTAGTEFHE